MAYCENCGKQIADQAVMCPACGQPQGALGTSLNPGPTPYAQAGPAHAPYATGPRTEGTAVASLVLGIAGLFICPIVCSVLALVFGSQAKTKIRSDPSLGGEGMANAGWILGWIGIGLGVLILLIFIIAAVNNSSSSSDLGHLLVV